MSSCQPDTHEQNEEVVLMQCLADGLIAVCTNKSLYITDSHLRPLRLPPTQGVSLSFRTFFTAASTPLRIHWSTPAPSTTRETSSYLLLLLFHNGHVAIVDLDLGGSESGETVARKLSRQYLTDGVGERAMEVLQGETGGRFDLFLGTYDR